MPRLSKRQRQSANENKKKKNGRCPHNNKNQNQSCRPNRTDIINISELASAWNHYFHGRKVAEINLNQSDSISLTTVKKKYGIDAVYNWCGICQPYCICIGSVGITNMLSLNAGVG
eukprot:26335_1